MIWVHNELCIFEVKWLKSWTYNNSTLSYKIDIQNFLSHSLFHIKRLKRMVCEICFWYSKTCVKRPLKNRQIKILMTNDSLMKAKSIAECSPLSILQYIWPALSDNWSWKPIFDLFESDHFTQVLLYIKELKSCYILYIIESSGSTYSNVSGFSGMSISFDSQVPPPSSQIWPTSLACNIA